MGLNSPDSQEYACGIQVRPGFQVLGLFAHHHMHGSFALSHFGDLIAQSAHVQALPEVFA